jgi:hypothetical protein
MTKELNISASHTDAKHALDEVCPMASGAITIQTNAGHLVFEGEQAKTIMGMVAHYIEDHLKYGHIASMDDVIVMVRKCESHEELVKLIDKTDQIFNFGELPSTEEHWFSLSEVVSQARKRFEQEHK